jgi:hypothetical protein
MYVQEKIIEIQSNKKTHSTRKREKKRLNLNYRSRATILRVNLQIRLSEMLDLFQILKFCSHNLK